MAHDCAAINAMDCAGFVSAVGGVYEKSPWVAERAFKSAPFDSLTALTAAMKTAVDTAAEAEQLALLRAHPDLAGKAALAGDLTAESTEEQAKAGLGSLTAEELARFQTLNSAYRAKFDFPFILAVRNASKGLILNAFEPRISNTRGLELAAAIAQVHKIAWMRLRLIVRHEPVGKLTCHVLDTARGAPAAGMAIALRRRNPDGEWALLVAYAMPCHAMPCHDMT